MANVTLRRELERRIVSTIVRDCLKAGYRLAVSLERGYDTDTMLLGSLDAKKIINECMAGDDCHLFLQPAAGPTVENGKVVSLGWVYLVFGNDGWDVVSDYTTNLDALEVLKRAEKISAKYQ